MTRGNVSDYQSRHRDALLEKRSFLWRMLGYVMKFLSRNCAATDTQCCLGNSPANPDQPSIAIRAKGRKRDKGAALAANRPFKFFECRVR